jgi:hypothetical protein
LFNAILTYRNADSAKTPQFISLLADSKIVMWCIHCRQDVPALSPGGWQTFCCPRCGEAICDTPSVAADPVAAEALAGNSSRGNTAAATAVAGSSPPYFDAWEFDEQLRHIERVLQLAKAQGLPRGAADRSETDRRDAPHAGPPEWHRSLAEERRKAKSAARGNGRRRHGVFTRTVTWTVLLLGTTSFVCGVALLGWSMVSHQSELWTIGLPIAAVGQVALLVGLVLQIEGLWHDNHATVVKLNDVDDKLQELKTTTTQLDAAHGPAASTFYSHLANGASCQILLTDLKSQIDLLATKIADDGR